MIKIALFVFLVVLLLTMPRIEGMTTNECLSKGYTKEFCMENPWPSMCRCEDGRIGTLLGGFKGQCVCG